MISYEIRIGYSHFLISLKKNKRNQRNLEYYKIYWNIRMEEILDKIYFFCVVFLKISNFFRFISIKYKCKKWIKNV